MPQQPGPAEPFPASAAPLPVSGEAAAAQLTQASHALWLASLSLMTAFMHTPAPAHRLMMARRLAGNFRTLAQQPCFDRRACASFARLASHWQANADRLAGS